MHLVSWAGKQCTNASLFCYATSHCSCAPNTHRCLSLLLFLQLLRVGCIAFTPPVPTVSESDLKQVDIQEGYQVDLAPGSALPCVVSFSPGQERRVYFAGKCIGLLQ